MPALWVDHDQVWSCPRTIEHHGDWRTAFPLGPTGEGIFHLLVGWPPCIGVDGDPCAPLNKAHFWVPGMLQLL